MTPQELIQITGQHLLFLGLPTVNWQLPQFQQAAQFAAQHGVDSLLVKTHDGTNAWYGGIGGWSAVRQTILNEGVGAIPYTYSYGDKFGALDTEIDILIAHMQDTGIVCMDAEAEWNEHTDWGQHLCSRMQSVAGTFLVSTWADPSIQGWDGIIQAMAPCVTVWMPQIYSTFLAQFWSEFGQNGATWLQPTVDLTQEFGTNDPVAIARDAAGQGHTAISVWSYDTAVANPGLLDAVYTAFPKEAPMPSVNPNIAQAAQDTWNSTAFLFGGTPLPYDTGIAQAWQTQYVDGAKNMPPPTTPEFGSVGWDGTPITVQFFGSLRCEWDQSAQAHWYEAGV